MTNGKRLWKFLTRNMNLLMKHTTCSPDLTHFYSQLYMRHDRDAFWAAGGGPTVYVTRAKSCIRKCVLEMLPNMAEKNSFGALYPRR
jgi:hypothetical protein